MDIKSSASMNGMLGAQLKLNEVAHSTANSSSSATDNAVGMIKSENQFKTNSESLKTADEMLGTLLDLKA